MSQPRPRPMPRRSVASELDAQTPKQALVVASVAVHVIEGQRPTWAMITSTGIEAVGEFGETVGPGSQTLIIDAGFLAGLTVVLEHPDLHGLPVEVHIASYRFYAKAYPFSQAWPLVSLVSLTSRGSALWVRACEAAKAHAAPPSDQFLTEQAIGSQMTNTATNRRRVAATDGSWNKTGNGKWAGFGWADDTGRVGSGSLRGNIVVAELAAIHALLLATPKTTRLEILVDSKVALRAIAAMRAGERLPDDVSRNMWGKHYVFMTDLRAKVLDRDLVFTWVRSHSGVLLNDIADRLAVAARREVEGGYEDETHTVRSNIAADLRDSLAVKELQDA